MLRSKTCVFLAHCLLAQMVRAEGLAKYYSSSVTPVVQFCLDNDISMMQMPCPEFSCAAGGPGRTPHGKVWYEKNGLRETSREIAVSQVAYMKRLTDNGFRVLAILGVEFSPACAVTLLNKGRRIERNQGIYVEELKAALEEADLDIPFVGVNQRALRKLDKDLKAILDQPES